MSQPVTLRVDAPPPAKDGAKSIRSPEHPQYRLTVALRAKMAEVMEVHRFDVAVLDDDGNIREFHYTEVPSEHDSYEVVVRPLGAPEA